MASGTFKFYGNFFKSLLNKEIDFNSDTIKVMLTSSSYSPDVDTHQYKSSVTNEVTGTNWAAGGVTLTGCTFDVDTSNVTGPPAESGRVRMFATDVNNANTTLTGARIAVIYDATPGSDATRPLIGFIDFGADLSPNDGMLTIDFDGTNGFGKITY